MTVATETALHITTEPDDDAQLSEIASIIEMRRRVLGISKAELARRTGCARVTVSKFINGRIDIASSTSWKMMEVMGAEVRWSAGF